MSNIKPVSVPSKRLAASMDASSSTMQLNNITGWDGNNLTPGDFGDVLYAVLRNDANTAMEIIEIDPTTIADSSITINKRGLKFDGDDLTTEVTANKLTWIKNETIVELGSNPPQLLGHFVKTINDETIAGVKTFSSLPATTAGNPVADSDLARKAYVDSVVGGIATTVNILVPGTAGATVAAGDLIYFDDTDNEWKLCDADTAATVENTLLGMAQGAGVDGGAISGGVMLRGLDANQSSLTAGAVYYASNTAGDISATPGTKEVTVGFSYSTTQLYFNPRFNQQLTEDQQDALAGTSGTPSSTNKYVTNDDVSDAGGSGKIVRATGTALPALDGSNLTSLNFNEKLHSFTSNVSFSNVNTEQTIMSFTLAANTLGTANIVKVRIPVTDFGLQSAGSDTFTLRLKYGATTIVSVASTNDGSNFNSAPGYIEAIIIAAGATGSQEGSIFFAPSEVTGNRAIVFSGTGTSSEDSTGALTIAITGQFSVANASNDFTSPHGYVEIVRT